VPCAGGSSPNPSTGNHAFDRELDVAAGLVGAVPREKNRAYGAGHDGAVLGLGIVLGPRPRPTPVHSGLARPPAGRRRRNNSRRHAVHLAEHAGSREWPIVCSCIVPLETKSHQGAARPAANAVSPLDRPKSRTSRFPAAFSPDRGHERSPEPNGGFSRHRPGRPPNRPPRTAAGARLHRVRRVGTRSPRRSLMLAPGILTF